jgi:hypothetical protein
VVYSGRRPGDPANLVADSTKVREVLGWEPRQSTLDEMVSSAWSWRQRFPRGYGDDDNESRRLEGNGFSNAPLGSPQEPTNVPLMAQGDDR